MPNVSQGGRRLLEGLKALSGDASTAEHFGQRALTLIQRAVPFNEGGLFLLDPQTLIFTRLLAYVGETLNQYLAWIRDIYLVRDHGTPLHFPTLLRTGRGAGAVHERFDRWLGLRPPPMSASEFSFLWREASSPAGGFLRCGLAYRRRWIAALQIERAEHGPGYRASELELLERAAPSLARGLATRVHIPPLGDEPPDAPSPGQVVFDDQRRLMGLSGSGHSWLTRLPADVPHHRSSSDADGLVVPVAVQSLVSHLAGSAAPHAVLSTFDRFGKRVIVRGERAFHLAASAPGDPLLGYVLTIEPGGLGLGAMEPSVTGGQWRVAKAVAEGLSDKEIAARLGVGVATVHERVGELHDLLGTRTRSQLVAALAATAAKSNAS